MTMYCQNDGEHLPLLESIRFRYVLSVAAIALSLSGTPQTIWAQATYWDGGSFTPNGIVDGGLGTWQAGSTNWTTLNGTSNATWPGGSSVATFSNMGGTVTINGTQSVGGITFNSNSYSLSGGTLTLANLVGQNQFHVGVGLSASIESTLAGSAGLAKAGSGTLILSGSNTFSGGLNVNGGTLAVRSLAAMGNSANHRNVAAGAKLSLASTTVEFNQFTSGTYTVRGNSVVEHNIGSAGAGAGQLSLDSPAPRNHTNFTGTINLVDGGALTSINGVGGARDDGGTWGNLRLNGGTIQASGTGNKIIATTMLINTSQLTSALDVALNSDLTVDTLLVGEGMRKTGTGRLILTNPSNQIRWATTIAAGELLISGAGRISNETNGGLANNYSQNISNNGSLVYNSTSDQLLSGLISGSGTLTKSSTSTLRLSGANTYSGSTNITNGTLVISNASALGTTAGSTTVSSGARLGLSGGITTDNESLTLSGSGIGFTGALFNLSGANTFAGPITLAAAASIGNSSGLTTDTLNLTNTLNNGGFSLTLTNGSAPISVSGVISGSGGLIKDGSGTATLKNNNTYSGSTNVSAGTLRIDGTVGDIAGSSGVILSQGATFDLGRTNTYSFGKVISGAGNVIKSAQGSTTLMAVNTYNGTTTLNAGTLILGRSNAIPSNSAVTVASGSTLDLAGFSQQLSAGLVVNGTLAMGTGGTLRLNGGSNELVAVTGSGKIILETGATLTLRAAIENAGIDIELAGGNLVLGGFTHRLGTLTQSTSSAINFDNVSHLTVSNIGSQFTGDLSVIGWVNSFDSFFVTAINGNPARNTGNVAPLNQITLGGGNPRLTYWASTNELLLLGNYWDGNQTTANSLVDGGAGIWSTSSTNWTNSTGTANGLWAGGTDIAVFSGPSGTVQLTNPADIGGLTISADGYVISGDQPLNLRANENVFTLTDGVNAEIAVPLVGSGTLTKSGPGMLTLSVTSPDMTGPTDVSVGVLHLKEDITTAGQLQLPNTTGYILSNGSTLLIERNSTNGQLNQVVSGQGRLLKRGNAHLVVNVALTHTGLTEVDQGPITFLSGSTPATAPMQINSGAILAMGRSDIWGSHETSGHTRTKVAGMLRPVSSFNTFTNLELNGAHVRLNGGANANYGALAFKGTVTSTGTAIASAVNGTNNNFILIGNNFPGGETTFAISGTFNMNVALKNNRDVSENSVDSNLVKSGSGTLNLGAVNSYTGKTKVEEGVLSLLVAQAVPTSSEVSVANGATFNLNGLVQTLSRGLNSSGLLNLGNGGTLILSGGTSSLGAITGNGKVVIGVGATLTLTHPMSNSGVDIELAGGTLQLGSGLAHSLGGLSVTSGNSTLDFAVSGAVQVHFASVDVNNSAGLFVSGWVSGVDLFQAATVVGDPTRLITNQAPLNRIAFNSYSAADTNWRTALDEITPILALPMVRVSLVSEHDTGQFLYSLSGLSQPSLNLTTESPGVRVQSDWLLGSLGGGASLVQTTAPNGWLNNPSVICVDTNAAESGNGAGNLATLSGVQLNLDASHMVVGAQIVCTFTNTLNSKILGRVFNDGGAPHASGSNTGTPNNGLQDGAEAGFGGALVELSQCGGSVLARTHTNGLGEYTLVIPTVVVNQPLCIGASLSGSQIATGANVDNTPIPNGVNTSVAGLTYTYTRESQQLRFIAPATGVLRLNFGQVPASTWGPNSQSFASPGEFATHRHRFVAGTGGQLRLSVLPGVANPNSVQGWSESLYQDPDCTGSYQPGATRLFPPVTPLTLVQGQEVCVVLRSFVPGQATNGNQNQVSVHAELELTQDILVNYTVTDTTLANSALVGVYKQVRNLTVEGPTALWHTGNVAHSGHDLEYQITFTNHSASPINDVVISDNTSLWTTWRESAVVRVPMGMTCTANSPSNPVPSTSQPCAPTIVGNGKGAVTWFFSGALQPGDHGVVTYKVRVD